MQPLYMTVDNQAFVSTSILSWLVDHIWAAVQQISYIVYRKRPKIRRTKVWHIYQ